MSTFRTSSRLRSVTCALALSFLFLHLAAAGREAPGHWEVDAVLDVTGSSRALALGSRDRGLGLGHSDISAGGPLGAYLDARVTAVGQTADRRLQADLEEAWVQTRRLPAGWQLRTGRFFSQVGYLNEQHPHSDDFVQRPLLHRALLGGHWSDDGVRLNWTAPTETYLRLGLEAFRGRGLVQDAAAAARPGAYTLSARWGGDVGRDHSWQVGLSSLQNRREAAVDDHAGAPAHDHGAAFSGRRMRLADITWKWAPEGNNQREQVRVSFEHAVVSGLNRFASAGDRHRASYLSAVWRFAPAWEVGARGDVLRVRAPHDESFSDGRLRESALMLAYKPTHAQTLRLQWTRQRDQGGFAEAAQSVQLQYIVNFGHHAAHAF